MWLCEKNYMRIVDLKTGKTLALSKTKENDKYKQPASYVVFVPYLQNGEVKYMVHKSFDKLEDGQNYMAQLCTKLNQVMYNVQPLTL